MSKADHFIASTEARHSYNWANRHVEHMVNKPLKFVMAAKSVTATGLAKVLRVAEYYEVVMVRGVAIALLIIPGAAVSSAELDFHLCSAFVQQSVAEEQTDSGWPVHVELTKIGASRFEQFTEANIGRVGRLVVGDQAFFRATIMEPISSGEIRGSFSSQAIATAWQKTLADQLPKAPCGVGG